MEPISKEKALEKLKERLADASDETLKKNLETFITYLTSTKRNGNTTMVDIWVMTNYLFPYLKGKNVLIKDLTVIDVSEALKGLKLKETTLTMYAQKILAFINWERGRYMLPLLKLRYVAIPRGEAKSKVINDQLTDEMVRKAIDEMNSLRVQLATMLMWKFGMRLSEVLGLRWNDIQRTYDNYVIIIKYREGDYGAKGVKSERIISFKDVENLKMLDSDEEIEIRSLFDMIRNKYKTQRIIGLYKSYVGAAIVKAGKKAGIPFRLHPHLLRHHFIVSALDHGASLIDVQRITGDSLITLSRYYAWALKKPTSVEDRGV
ncbi:MAG: site-specific integrase [Nitrososphaeria archaeon]